MVVEDRQAGRQREADPGQPFGKAMSAVTLQVDRDAALLLRLGNPGFQRRGFRDGEIG